MWLKYETVSWLNEISRTCGGQRLERLLYELLYVDLNSINSVTWACKKKEEKEICPLNHWGFLMTFSKLGEWILVDTGLTWKDIRLTKIITAVVYSAAPLKEQSSRLRRGTSQLDSSCATRERQLFIYLLIYLDTSLPLKIINILFLKEKKEKEE